VGGEVVAAVLVLVLVLVVVCVLLLITEMMATVAAVVVWDVLLWKFAGLALGVSLPPGRAAGLGPSTPGRC
jgi:hypothetical protein